MGLSIDSASPLSSSNLPTEADLALGASGAAVSAMQQQLASAGFSPGAADGKFGPHTLSALRSFQSSAGVPVTGLLDAATSSALAQAITTQTPPPATRCDTFQPAAAVTPMSLSGASSTTQVPPGVNSAALAAIDNAHLSPGAAHSCVTTVRNNLDRAGLKGLPASTGEDPNNPRGMMVQMLQSGDWCTSAIPGSEQETIRSPYGTVQAHVLSASAYREAVASGQIPNGAVVFQTEHGWGYGGGSSGNDVAIARNGNLFNYTQFPGMTSVYRNLQQLVVLLPTAAPA